jgi:acetolactate synthase I/II/III large subunit
MIKVSDYIAQTLAAHGIRDVFLVTGGGAMHLNDAIAKCPDLTHICCHHEQACAIAAESYYRLTNRLAAVNVTTGPGGTNAITGVFGAWTDSLGMIVISGQVKWETLVRSTDLPLRQLGDQEIDIIKMVESITKYAVIVIDPTSIRYHLERALYLAQAGRPGPVWLDIPMNVQGAQIDETTLVGYDPIEDLLPSTATDLTPICAQILDRLQQAERPVILAGPGIRLGKATSEFLDLVDRLGIPVVTSFNAHDLIWYEHPAFIGRQGTIGDRAGNFAVQNSDFLLVLGCRLNIRQISYGWESFARNAYKVIVDIDPAELAKPTISPDLPVCADVADVIKGLISSQPSSAPATHQDWLKWCQERKAKYPVVLPEYWHKSTPVNPYCWAETLFEELTENEVVVSGDATACIVPFQAAKLKKGQRLYSNSGCASMGYDLPAAIGACIANNRQRTICLAGDGSIQMNIQELQTIVGYRLPIKIFVLNNQGYHSIRQTQTNYFPDSPIGCDPSSGVTFPSFEKLAFAYGIPFRRCSDLSTLSADVKSTVWEDGPQLCEIIIDQNQPFAPKLSSRQLPDGRMVSAALEDMFPFLDRAEFLSNMLIPTLAE